MLSLYLTIVLTHYKWVFCTWIVPWDYHICSHWYLKLILLLVTLCLFNYFLNHSC